MSAWSAQRPHRFGMPDRQLYRNGDYVVAANWARGRGGRRLKTVVWHLTLRGRRIGNPFASARLARAFADAYDALGDDRRAKAEMIRNGWEWCNEQEKAWRRDG